MSPSSELISVLSANPFFQSFDSNQISQIAQQGVQREFSAGELILREGDAGDCFYLLMKGSVQVFTEVLGGEPLVLARLEPGEIFGEQGFLQQGPKYRSDSIRCIDAVRVFEISYRSLMNSLNSDRELRQEMDRRGDQHQRNRRHLLQQAFSPSFNTAAGDADVTTNIYEAGESIFAEGDAGQRVYLLLTGSLSVTQHESPGKESLQVFLVPGNWFGELALIHQQPRGASVTALAQSEVLSFDGAFFLKARSQNPALNSLMEALVDSYRLPNLGVTVRQSGQLNGEPCLTTTYLLDDGRRVIATRVVGQTTFCATVSGDQGDQGEAIQFNSADPTERREMTITTGRIMRLYSEGKWSRLGLAFESLLKGTLVRPWQMALFRETGELDQQQHSGIVEETDTVCACMSVTLEMLRAAMMGGCLTLDAIASKTGATTVCGGCIPAVNEMLGRSDWIAASLVAVIPLTQEIHAFRFEPREGECLPYKPGQHIVVQGRIANRWVQRSYTLSSASGKSGYYEITVKREPKGLFSRWLFERHSASELFRLSKPRGHYYLPDNPASNVVCLMGGIGITPAIAMCRSLVGTNRAYHLHVDYSVSSSLEQIGTEEFAEFAARDQQLTFRVRLTRTEGRITQDEIQELVKAYPSATFFLCAGAGYLQTVSSYLRQAGIAEEQIRIEIFTPAATKTTGKTLETTGIPATIGRPIMAAETSPPNPVQEAEDYLRQFFEETGHTEQLAERWEQVQQEFQQQGTYTQTFQELEYAARLAWRNSIRCVGRLYWQGLIVRDFRHVTNENQMFDALFEHIHLATNGGNLRAVMTVFPPEKQLPARVWSPQLFRYAGYPQPEGSILGDPANVEVTKVALGLGWNPPAVRTRFDLLPIIVQIGGRRPQFREIPKDLVLEVPFEHPDYPWFAELGLKWYSLPAVSEMKMDAGGIIYPAIPFNGWYQGTEIGARNLSDTHRYNMLPLIAKKMGLDMRTDRTLWKDRALIELNVAVLHSFEKQGVKMVDHHSTAKSFEEFEENEKQAGRPVFAKWNWIVPPISGSTTNAYLQGAKWKPVTLKPNFYRQSIPWEQDLSWKAEAEPGASSK